MKQKEEETRPDRIEFSSAQKTPEELTPNEIEEIILAAGAQGAFINIILYAQLTPEKQKEYFSRKRTPIRSNIPPKNPEEKRAFYASIGKFLVKKWKENPENVSLRKKAGKFMSYTAYELFSKEIYIQGLSSVGYLVGKGGLVEGIDPDYLVPLKKFAKKMDFDLKELDRKIGGLTRDILVRAKLNLKLNKLEIEFIDSFLLQNRETPRSKKYLLASLKLAEKTRRYWLDAGFKLDDFMKIWGINTNFETTKRILYDEAMQGDSCRKLLHATTSFVGSDNTTQAEAMYEKAVALELPTKLPTWDEIKKRNQQISDDVQTIMRYEQITDKKIEPESLILTGSPGARSRGVSITYLNYQKEMVSIQIMGAYSPVNKLKPTMAHELTHETHAFLITKYKSGIEAWEKVNSSIREQFAKLVDSSFKAITLNKQRPGTKKDTYTPTLIEWASFAYGYSQLRFLEKINRQNKEVSDEELLQIHNEITAEMKNIYFIQEGNKTLDLTKFRTAPRNNLKLHDGVVYKIAHINQIIAKKEKDYSGNDNSSKESVTAKQLMEKKWGPYWIKELSAYKVFIVAMLKSSELANTEEVVNYIKELIESPIEEIDKILQSHEINLSD